MCKFIKIRHDIIKQCHGNCKEMKKFNYKLEIEIFRNSSQKYWVSWGVLFKGLGVQKGTQTPCWLRPWGDVHFTHNFCQTRLETNRQTLGSTMGCHIWLACGSSLSVLQNFPGTLTHSILQYCTGTYSLRSGPYLQHCMLATRNLLHYSYILET